MKKILLLLVASAFSFTAIQETSAQTEAQTAAQSDTTTTASTAKRINALKDKKKALQDQIKIEDSKRNKQISGVSPETMEQMNDKQDSICLELRSELVAVTLEIDELTPNFSPSGLLNQYNTLLSKKDSLNNTQESQSHPVRVHLPMKKDLQTPEASSDSIEAID